MLKSLGPFGIPNFTDLNRSSQVVDMPVGAPDRSQVMLDSGGQTAGTQRAAHVSVVAFCQHQLAESADSAFALRFAAQPEQIGPGAAIRLQSRSPRLAITAGKTS